MQEILVEHVMSRDVPVVPASGTLEMAVRKMAADSLSCVVAVNDAGRPVGIVTERDMLSYAARILDGGRGWQERVRDHMSTNLVYLHPEQSLFEALVVARAREVRHLPVLDHDEVLVGLVTATELVRAHFDVFESQRMAADTVAVREEDFASVTSRLRLLSLEDPLLRIGNRRALEVDLQHTEQAARRYQHVYSLTMFDVDRFKAYNDNYGHPAGDRVLAQIARVFTQSLRGADRLYRYGGEEILLLMTETDLAGAVLVADRLRASLEAAAIPHAHTERGVVTVSGGVAEGGFRHTTEGWEAVIEQADRALYRAKNAGRNRVESDTGQPGK